MSKEQSIDDILMLLRNSVNQDPMTPDNEKSHESLSDEVLQETLKARFATNLAENGNEIEGDPYQLDKDFLDTANINETPTVMDDLPPFDLSEPANELTIDCEPPFERLDGNIITEPSSVTECIEEKEISLQSALEASDMEKVADEPVQEISAENAIEDVVLYTSEGDDQLSLFERTMTEDFSVDDEFGDVPDNWYEDNQIIIDFEANESYDEIGETAFEALEEPDEDSLNLMLELGYDNACSKAVSEQRLASFVERERAAEARKLDPSEVFAFEGVEYHDDNQTEEIRASYVKEQFWLRLRLAGCSVLSLLLFVYEIFPSFGLSFGGFLNYYQYPTTSILISVQVLILVFVLSWRELWCGLKKAFGFEAEPWSLIALGGLFALLMDVCMICLKPVESPALFNGLVSLGIAFGLLMELLKLQREMLCFDIYAADCVKFTAVKDISRGSAAEKMYRGGLSHKKNIFSPKEIRFPSGYFSAVNAKSTPDPLVNYCVSPLVILCTFISVLSVVLGNEPNVSVSAFFITYFCLAPIAVLAIHTLPIALVSKRLYIRECAIAGETAALHYASCDIMIFHDSHLFGKCKGTECGIVMYDKKNAHTTLRYLNALYQAIGGPMSNAFANVPNGNREVSIHFRRIARNGLEAVVNNTNNVLLGDAAFLTRYGICMPSDGEERAELGGRLCFVINDRPAAMLLLQYHAEPLFEILSRSLAQEGIDCVIETYDPIISGSFVAKCRAHDSAPIGVVHKNADDYYRKDVPESENQTDIVVCKSRLKLIECFIYCKRLKRIIRSGRIMLLILLALFASLLVASCCMGWLQYVNAIIALFFQFFGVFSVWLITKIQMPSAHDLFLSDTTCNK